MKIAAGDLTERVTIQAEVNAPDGGGGNAVSWTAVATAWARIEPVRAAETLQGQLQQGAVTWRVVIRRRQDVSHGSRLLWTPHGGAQRQLNVRSAHDLDGGREFTEILAEEGVAV